jgi:hypothetical protein
MNYVVDFLILIETQSMRLLLFPGFDDLSHRTSTTINKGFRLFVSTRRTAGAIGCCPHCQIRDSCSCSRTIPFLVGRQSPPNASPPALAPDWPHNIECPARTWRLTTRRLISSVSNSRSLSSSICPMTPEIVPLSPNLSRSWLIELPQLNATPFLIRTNVRPCL